MSSLPSFDSLPLQKDGPRGNAWGLYGPGDELGMLNRLTPTNTISALKEATLGIRVSTDWFLDQPSMPCFGRQKFEHFIKHKEPRTVNDDIITMNTQSSSQWDGFRHFGYQDHKVYFNGCKQEEIHSSTRNGTHVWVENGGVVGRGILLDYAAWAQSQGRKINCLETSIITIQDLEAVAKSQNTIFKPNDILFVRSGFIPSLSSLPTDQASVYAKAEHSPIPAIGVQASEETLRWIWEKQFVAVAGDMPAFEALPFQSEKFWMHEWLLAGWGLPIGELFDLEKLAEECRKAGKWSFFFSSVPLKIPGGVASPPNGVAIL